MTKLFKVCFSCLIVISVSCKESSSESEVLERHSKLVNQNDIERIEPSHWWVGFENKTLQLLVHHPRISDYTPVINYKGVSVTDVARGNNSDNYLFIDLKVSENAKAGQFNIVFRNDKGEELIAIFELKERQKPAHDFVGFDSSDAVYLITPDRFSNANPDNDRFDNLHQKTIDRTDGYARHGGDIEGITNHLDYIKDLGFTTIWPCPMLENDMYQGSYHGYAITDYYKVDPRFGTLEDYKKLSVELDKRGMKLMMDQVANHCGLEHWWMKDIPFTDWVNFQDHYEANKDHWDWRVTKYSNHMRTVNQDNYASNSDRQGMTDGWFVEGMPDLNQRNPYMAKYIIQNSIWWIETLGLGGIRQDTYPYPDKDFMSDWAKAIMFEYPNFNIVGEEWSTNPLLIAYWQDGNENPDGYTSNLRSTMDFAMQDIVVKGIKNKETWGTGLKELYVGLANDFSYKRPKDIMVFPDNHDMSRIYTQMEGDVTHTKMALSYYAVLPRIFQMYYGTEILMDDFDKPGDHGTIRSDFPGGWEGDSINAFTGEGLEAQSKEMQNFVRKLMNYRKSSKAIHEGKTMHFVPVDGTYLLTRSFKDETVVLLLNKNDTPITLDLERYNEVGLNGKTLRNVISGESVHWDTSLVLQKKGVTFLTTKDKL